MSQPTGRNPGSRNKGPRHPRQPPDTASHRQNRAYVKPAPARDVAQTASIFKTRSFKWLVDSVGAENIALGLESSPSRVTELVRGERFTPETAFHIETTLGLPEGFFDQPNPSLTPETIDRLKAPLDFVRADTGREMAEEQEAESMPLRPADNSTSNDILLRETAMPRKTGGGLARVKANSRGTTTKPASEPLPGTASPERKSTTKRGAQQSLPLNDEAALQTIRSANLHLLTSRKGSKVRLAKVMNISASNLDNRLYGQKRMDEAEARRFTDRLGMPVAWLDVSRTVADIPETVSALLDPQASRSPSVQRKPSTAIKPETVLPMKSAGKKAKTANRPQAEPSGTDQHDDAGLTTAVAGPEDPIPKPVSDPVTGHEVDSDAASTASDQPLVTASYTEVVSVPRRSSPVTSLDDLAGIEPIAEALIKTLAGKARTGRLDEMKALELLRQIVSF